MKSLVILIFAVLISLASGPSAIAQCAMCKATVESNSKSKDVTIGKGLNKGILYLMTIPYLLVGGLGYLWYVNSKKDAKRKHAPRNFGGKMPSM